MKSCCHGQNLSVMVARHIRAPWVQWLNLPQCHLLSAAPRSDLNAWLPTAAAPTPSSALPGVEGWVQKVPQAKDMASA
jgi:hypothetical protein